MSDAVEHAVVESGSTSARVEAVDEVKSMTQAQLEPFKQTMMDSMMATMAGGHAIGLVVSGSDAGGVAVGGNGEPAQAGAARAQAGFACMWARNCCRRAWRRAHDR